MIIEDEDGLPILTVIVKCQRAADGVSQMMSKLPVGVIIYVVLKVITTRKYACLHSKEKSSRHRHSEDEFHLEPTSGYFWVKALGIVNILTCVACASDTDPDPIDLGRVSLALLV